MEFVDALFIFHFWSDQLFRHLPFSLDVEGSELAILKTIPFDKVNIMVCNLPLFLANDAFKY